MSDNLIPSSRSASEGSCPQDKPPYTVEGKIAECGPRTPCPIDHMCTPPNFPGAKSVCCPVANIIGLYFLHNLVFSFFDFYITKVLFLILKIVF